MALPTLIEIHTGPDRRLRLELWAIWLTALGSLLLNAPRMPLPLLIIAIIALGWSAPWRTSLSLQGHRLQLHANGTVCYGEAHGNWEPDIWRSPWYTVVSLQIGKTRWRAWISAANNTPDAYRQLGIWGRFSPQEQVADTNHV